MKTEKQKAKRILAKKAFSQTNLKKAISFLGIASIIILVLVSTIGWIWLDWYHIWRADLSLLGVLVSGMLVDNLAPLLIEYAYEEDLEKLADTKQESVSSLIREKYGYKPNRS